MTAKKFRCLQYRTCIKLSSGLQYIKVDIFCRNYPQSGIVSLIGDIKSQVGDNIPNWKLGISESYKAESENKSPISNCIKYLKVGIQNNQLGIINQIGYFFCNSSNGDLFSVLCAA